MSYLLNDGDSEYLEIDSTPVTVYPYAAACWFNCDDSANDGTLLFIGDKDVANEFYILRVNKVDTTGTVSAYSLSGTTGSGGATSTTSYTNNAWHHICGLFVSATDRRVLLNAAGKGTDANNSTPAGADRISIGRRGDSSPSAYFSGYVAEMAIWDLSNWPGATAADKANLFETIVPGLAKGISPRFYSLGLKAHHRFVDNPNDWFGAYNLTATNGPTISPHPDIFVPNSGGSILVPVGAAPSAEGIMTLNTGYWGAI